MQSFHLYATATSDDERKKFGLDTPTSFWIRNMQLSEDEAISFILALNFYLTYYDHASPHVVIHPTDLGPKVSDKHRYIEGSFPSQVGARKLDETLLSYWMTSLNETNQIIKFLYCYRIIEYAAFHYLDAKTKIKLRRILSDPALCNKIDTTIEGLLSSMDGLKLDDVPRFDSVVQEHVRPAVIWKEVEASKDAFSQRTNFDGGFVLEALISKNDNENSLSIVKFSKSIRSLRNVLAHARDSTTGTAVLPTRRNMMLLKPWVNAIIAASGEVVLYGQ